MIKMAYVGDGMYPNKRWRLFLFQSVLLLSAANSFSNHRLSATYTKLCRTRSLFQNLERNHLADDNIDGRANGTGTRREWWKQQMKHIAVALSSANVISTSPPKTMAAETVGKDPDCNDATCIGVWDGLLADCPHGKVVMNSGAGCAASQDDTPGIFAEPWDYSEAPNNSLDWEEQMRLLVPAIQLVSSKRGDKATVLTQSGRYLRVLFVDGKTSEQSLGEFYFTPSDTTVQFRVGSLGGNGGLLSSSLKNLERCELIRKQLRYTKLPVLRNRKRTLFFVESDLDSFGPGSASLGPPAEMTTGELEGRQDVDPKLKIDLLQSFPVIK